MKQDPVKFNRVSKSRHLDHNKLMKEHFAIQKSIKDNKEKKQKK